MQAGPVDFELFTTVIGAIAVAGVAAFGWMSRRADKLQARLDNLATRLEASDKRNTDRHDNGLADVWQALEAHRVESRAASTEAAKMASAFRERTLTELGEIKATLARLTPPFLQPQPQPEP